MAKAEKSGVVWLFLRRFLGSIGLMFIPVPISIFRRQLAGKHIEGGDLEFYSHPNFACTMHLIWVGWLVTLVTYCNDIASNNGWAIAMEQEQMAVLSWTWIFILIVTMIVMGLQFARVAVGFLVAAILLTIMGLSLIQVLSDIPLFKSLSVVVAKIPVVVEWGVPMVVSFVLGITFVCVATWRRMDDCWTLKPLGNYLEHHNFQEKDRTISKGAKTFVAVYPCLLRRYLLFGFGDIEVRSSTGTKLIDCIDGVFFAKHHTEVIKYRFSTTDISITDEEREELDVDEGGDEEEEL